MWQVPLHHGARDLSYTCFATSNFGKVNLTVFQCLHLNTRLSVSDDLTEVPKWQPVVWIWPVDIFGSYWCFYTTTGFSTKIFHIKLFSSFNKNLSQDCWNHHMATLCLSCKVTALYRCKLPLAGFSSSLQVLFFF